MEGVIEISSDEEEDAKPSKGTKRSLFPEVIVISSPNDTSLEESPAKRKPITMRISSSRLNRLREITKSTRARAAAASHGPNGSIAVVNGPQLSEASPILIDSDDGDIALPSGLCRDKSPNKECKVTRLKGQVNLTDFRQSPLSELLEETSQKAVCYRSPTRKISLFQKMHKSPVNSPTSSPKLRQTTLTPDSFLPKISPAQLSSRQTHPVPCVPPQHIVSSGLASPNVTTQFFTESQSIILESLLEEEVLQMNFLATVISFTSLYRKPTPELVQKMLQKILLTNKKTAITSSCYRALKLIQTLHPDVAANAVERLTWDFVQEIVEQLDLWRCSNGQKPSDGGSHVAFQNASLALAFVVSVLEDDLKRKCNAKKSKAFRMLSVISCLQNVERVVEWIRVVVQHVSDSPCPQDSFLVTISPFFCQDILSLFQRLLQLSLDVSDLPIDSARRITNGPLIWAYMHPSISSVECKTLLLETLQSHLLRSVFIELIFQNYCQESGNPCHCGLQRIVNTYFLYEPPSYLNEESSDCRGQSECEEFVMLLAYLLQSYIFCRAKGFQSADPEDILPKEDVDTLLHIDRDVAELQDRLEGMCNPLSEKTYQLLDLIVTLQSFAK